MPRVAVIALGSVLRGDDGIGSLVLERFEARYEFPLELERLGVPATSRDQPLAPDLWWQRSS